ncbi:helix-turn-helix transcriptional regulator [Streptacidiphilus cavernicola]|uniref:Helix-turn-helix transcriptional regulator n=1 Tax=Streptacidiphilus cavernicola TaxID=3342716 RepID=A0ABV6VVS1_9ACTN
MGDNTALRERIAQLGLTQSELAHQINTAIGNLTGRYGTVSERTIHGLLTRTRWPQAKQRAALEAVFGCPVEQLGFTPPKNQDQHRSQPEQPVRRRAFLTSTTGVAAAVALPILAPPAVGSSDVLRLRSGLDALTDLDDRRGGHRALETAALAGAATAVNLQQGRASERIHQRLYSLAADYTAVAAWSCIDARELDRAQQHLDRATTLAGLSGDAVVQLRVWNFMAMLAHHGQRPADAIAAAHAAGATQAARRDPLYASLVHARTAVGHSDRRDRQAALRSLGLARDALGKAADQPRPSWVAFYGPAELQAINAIVRQQLGEHEQAEAASHQAISAIPPQFRRNRALATVRLAQAQLGQGDVDLACGSAHRVIDLMAGDPLPGRMRTLLGDFHRTLLTAAPHTPATLEWADRARTEWSRQP